MIQFPYGIADFRRIRREGRVYVDRTAHIRHLEELGDILVFLRPRRFGKSLWVQTLATYYDLRYADTFDEIFGGLDIASGERGPTPLANRYFVLQWNFSLINPRGGVEAIAKELRNHVRDQAAAFVSDYEGHLPAPVRTEGSPQSVLLSLTSVVRKTPYKLYLLIDEYDNFVNEVMVKDASTYKALFEADLTEVPGRLRIPNLVVRKLFLDRLLEVFLPDRAESYEARKIAMCFFEDGDLAPLLGFFEDKLLPVLSNRDQGAAPQEHGQSGGGVNEMVLKALFLSLLFDDHRFVVHSELEVEKGYVGLCLLVRPESRYPDPFDILFELKLVRRKALGKPGRELAGMDEAALRRLPAVQAALAEAREQVERYRDALVRQRGDSVRPRGYAVVAVGLERLLGEEVTAGPSSRGL